MRANSVMQDTGEKATEQESGNQPRTMAEARQMVFDLVRQRSVGIVEGIIEAASKGNAVCAKFLFEMAGVYPATEPTADGGKNDSLAYLLLKQLDLPTEERPSGEQAPGAAMTGATMRSGARKFVEADSGKGREQVREAVAENPGAWSQMAQRHIVE